MGIMGASGSGKTTLLNCISTIDRVVTDGILLTQIQRDPKLMQYDTIVIDEAHR